MRLSSSVSELNAGPAGVLEETAGGNDGGMKAKSGGGGNK